MKDVCVTRPADPTVCNRTAGGSRWNVDGASGARSSVTAWAGDGPTITGMSRIRETMVRWIWPHRTASGAGPSPSAASRSATPSSPIASMWAIPVVKGGWCITRSVGGVALHEPRGEPVRPRGVDPSAQRAGNAGVEKQDAHRPDLRHVSHVPHRVDHAVGQHVPERVAVVVAGDRQPGDLEAVELAARGRVFLGRSQIDEIPGDDDGVGTRGERVQVVDRRSEESAGVDPPVGERAAGTDMEVGELGDDRRLLGDHRHRGSFLSRIIRRSA